VPAYAILYFMFAGGLNWLELFSIPRYISLPLCYISVVLLALANAFISGNSKNKVVDFISEVLALPINFISTPAFIVFSFCFVIWRQGIQLLIFIGIVWGLITLFEVL